MNFTTTAMVHLKNRRDARQNQRNRSILIKCLVGTALCATLIISFTGYDPSSSPDHRQLTGTPVPDFPEWKEITDESGRVYYMNEKECVNQYEHPGRSLPEGWVEKIDREFSNTKYYLNEAGERRRTFPTETDEIIKKLRSGMDEAHKIKNEPTGRSEMKTKKYLSTIKQISETLLPVIKRAGNARSGEKDMNPILMSLFSFENNAFQFVISVAEVNVNRSTVAEDYYKIFRSFVAPVSKMMKNETIKELAAYPHMKFMFTTLMTFADKWAKFDWSGDSKLKLQPKGLNWEKMQRKWTDVSNWLHQVNKNHVELSK